MCDAQEPNNQMVTGLSSHLDRIDAEAELASRTYRYHIHDFMFCLAEGGASSEMNDYLIEPVGQDSKGHLLFAAEAAMRGMNDEAQKAFREFVVSAAVDYAKDKLNGA